MPSRACCAGVRGQDCHCAVCHETFSSLHWFDKHQDVAHGAKLTPVIICHPPATLGLVKDYRDTWTTPEAAASRLALAERASRGIRKAA